MFEIYCYMKIYLGLYVSMFKTGPCVCYICNILFLCPLCELEKYVFSSLFADFIATYLFICKKLHACSGSTEKDSSIYSGVSYENYSVYMRQVLNI